MKRELRNELLKTARTMVHMIVNDKELAKIYNKVCEDQKVNTTKIENVPRWHVKDSIKSLELLELNKICVAILKTKIERERA